MDLNTITGYRFARTRDDLRLAPGETIVAGGTWFFSEPQVDSTGVVDISGIDWPAFEDLPDGGLRVAATATISSLATLPLRLEWPAQRLFAQCADALLASFKIQHVATVGGNVCRSFAAASMVSLMAGLDAVAHIWCPDGTDRREPVGVRVVGDREVGVLRGGEGQHEHVEEGVRGVARRDRAGAIHEEPITTAVFLSQRLWVACVMRVTPFCELWGFARVGSMTSEVMINR